MPRWAYRGSPILLGLVTGMLALASIGGDASGVDPPLADLSPDLRPDHTTMKPSPAYEGDILRLSVTVDNRGETAALSAAIELTDARPNGDSVFIGRASLTGLLAEGASVTVSMPPFVAVGTGTHTLTIRIADVMPLEVNTGNNALAVDMTVQEWKEVPPPLPPPAGGIRVEALATLGIGIATGLFAVALVAAIVTGLLRTRWKGPLVPPPPEPSDRNPPPIWPP